MDNKYITAIGLIVVLILGVFLPFGNESKTVVERVVERDAGLNSPDLFVGNVRLASSYTANLTQATSSVLCSLQSPAATSTLMMGAISTTNGTSSATILTFNRSSQPFATTTTALNTYSIVSSGRLNHTFASSTLQFSPNTYLVIALQGGGITSLNGTCEALWFPIN